MSAQRDRPLDLDLVAAGEVSPATAPTRAVERTPRRRRNQVCIGVIALGMLNFVVYTALYAALGGDAHNGERRLIAAGDEGTRAAYFVRGHFLRTADGQEREVARSTWVYSYLHSISVLATSAAMIISMLVLARPHIVATMRDGWISGETFVASFGTVVILLTIVAVTLFVIDFAGQIG